jgi:hypothetical protein
MFRSAIALTTVALAQAAEPLLRFQGTSAMLTADDASGPAGPTVDPSTQTMGLPVKQKLNIGEKTSLSPAMQATLCLVALYYGVILIQFIIGIKGELAMITKNEEKTDGTKPVTKAGEAKADDEMQKQMDNINKILDDTKETTALIPMIAILIVFARLRAKVDLEGTNPTATCRSAFFGTVGIIYTQAFFGFIFGCIQSAMGASKMLTMFKAFMKFALLCGLYVCIGIIFSSIMTMTKTASE